MYFCTANVTCSFFIYGRNRRCVGNSKRNLNTATCQNILNSDFSEDLLNQKYIAPFQSFTVELPNNFLCNNIMLRLVMRLQNLLQTSKSHSWWQVTNASYSLILNIFVHMGSEDWSQLHCDSESHHNLEHQQFKKVCKSHLPLLHIQNIARITDKVLQDKDK